MKQNYRLNKSNNKVSKLQTWKRTVFNRLLTNQILHFRVRIQLRDFPSRNKKMLILTSSITIKVSVKRKMEGLTHLYGLKLYQQTIYWARLIRWISIIMIAVVIRIRNLGLKFRTKRQKCNRIRVWRRKIRFRVSIWSSFWRCRRSISREIWTSSIQPEITIVMKV